MGACFIMVVLFYIHQQRRGTLRDSYFPTRPWTSGRNNAVFLFPRKLQLNSMLHMPFGSRRGQLTTTDLIRSRSSQVTLSVGLSVRLSFPRTCKLPLSEPVRTACETTFSAQAYQQALDNFRRLQNTLFSAQKQFRQAPFLVYHHQ